MIIYILCAIIIILIFLLISAIVYIYTFRKSIYDFISIRMKVFEKYKHNSHNEYAEGQIDLLDDLKESIDKF